MNTVEEILLSELTQARTYVERLLHAITDLSTAYHRQEIRACASNLTEELEKIVKEKFLNESYQAQTIIHREHIKTARSNFKNLCQFCEVILRLNPDKDKIIQDIGSVVNCIYLHAKQLHELTIKFTKLEIQSPRIGLIKEVKKEVAPIVRAVAEVKSFGPLSLIEGGLEDNEEDYSEFSEYEEDFTPKLYQLDIDKIINVTRDNQTSLLGLQAKREEKYETYISLGHKSAFDKKNDEALEHFSKAKSFNDTAEINTLLAWIYNLQGNKEMAKSLCLRAISLDPDFGPPYNDLGSILLSENQLEEAIKWFELAKKASKYQNREYPYINAGRAYMMIQRYEKAIVEFEKAIEISPDNEELIETVEKIKLSFEKEKSLKKSKDSYNPTPEV